MLETPPPHDCKGLEILALGEITIAVLVTGALFAGAPLLLVVLTFFAAHALWIGAVQLRRATLRPAQKQTPKIS